MTGCLLAAVFLLFARGAQAQQYAALTAGASVTRTLAADETVTLVYDSRAATDSGERYMLVELTYEAEGDSYPDPLLMVAFERVPFIFYAENQFTTNATYYDQVAFQLVKTYHYVVVDRLGHSPGRWFVTVTNLPVWSQQTLEFELTVTTSAAHPCPNRCSDHGTCTEDGTCACAAGWGDSDCSQLMYPIELDTAVATRLEVDEWRYYYISPLADGGPVPDDTSYITAEMEITSDPRCDALLYFKHEEAGFTALPTHYDFQYHSDSRSFYSYQNSYSVTNNPIEAGQYILGVYNYNGRQIRAGCDISLTIRACYSASACEEPEVVFEPTPGWFLGLFLVAALPLFCFVPLFYCIRRLRGRRDPGPVNWGGGGAAAPRPGLTAEEIAALPSFDLAEEEGGEGGRAAVAVEEAEAGGGGSRRAGLRGETCSVCLGELTAGERLKELPCGHVYHAECIGQWLRRQRVCPLCKADALEHRGGGGEEEQVQVPGTAMALRDGGASGDLELEDLEAAAESVESPPTPPRIRTPPREPTPPAGGGGGEPEQEEGP